MHECGDGDYCSSCRPVSLTSILLKSFEGVLLDTMVNQAEVNKLMKADLIFYPQNHSCLANTISFVDELIGKMNRGGKVSFWISRGLWIL